MTAFCLALTALATWAAARADDNTERRLLQVQTKQVAAVLSTAVLLIQDPLRTAVSTETVTGRPVDQRTFTALMAPSVGSGKLLVTASIWKASASGFSSLGQVGSAPIADPQAPEFRTFLRQALSAETFVSQGVRDGDERRLAFAMADPSSGSVVYAERQIPADRRSPVDRDSAFASLHYAIYLGQDPTDDTLQTTDLPLSALPLTGSGTDEVTIPFGDTVLTLQTSARSHLGAGLSERLPLMLLLGGLVLTAVAGRTTYQLAGGRREAEADAAIITELYERVESLYGQQRTLFEKLQRALLPHANPDVPQLAIASEYVAGAQGAEIGGDWYSIIGLGRDRFAFVVGDVSGHGIDAVAVMAHARFTLRAYLLDGHGPASTLEKCSHQFDITVDGHMTTAVVGVGNWRTGEITLASAGHPAPLLIDDERVGFVQPPTGRPLGTGPSTYEALTFTMPPGATLLCFTDGLVERRGEDIDTGMQRLARTVRGATGGSVDSLLEHTLQHQRNPDAPDDVAVLAMRWEPES